MSSMIAGHCPKCGAPYFLPSAWYGTIPPTPTPTCVCWNMPKVVTSTEFTIEQTEKAKEEDKMERIRELVAAKAEIEQLKRRERGYLSELADYAETTIEIRNENARHRNKIGEIEEETARLKAELEAAKAEIERLKKYTYAQFELQNAELVKENVNLKDKLQQAVAIIEAQK